ncbi:hypothetical protein [Comamonas endophytica]|uniref:type III secretion apparatus assembly chaperone SctY n=1 Tax=Comamonas endophytica TaxID=2949090 RepID=UPI001E3EEE00|nr:hypothetical protein [Acidovorax sp. D4N7]
MAGDNPASASSDEPQAAHATATPAQALEFMDVLAYIYLEHGLPDKAAVLLSARNLLAPDDARVLLTWALALVRSGKPEKALQTLERLAMLGAMGAEFHLVRAQALQMLDRQAEAASAMRAHVAMEPRATPPSSTWPGLPA